MPRNSRPVRKTRTTLHQAPILAEDDFAYLIERVRRSEHALRDEVLLRLSFNAGLRVKEMACLQWRKHLLDARGRIRDKIWVSRDIGKKSVEREIEIAPPLRAALERLRAVRPRDKFVIYPLAQVRAREPGEDMTQVGVNALTKYYGRLCDRYGLEGVTSHSGRRTAITHLANEAGQRSGFTLRDVQRMVGHRSLETTQGYIERSRSDAAMVSRTYA